MTLDLFTLTLMTALVVFTSGIVFLLETLLRRDHGAGRVWALAFLGGMLTTLSYLIWTVLPDPWVAIAVGNGALVASAGLLWLGCRVYNGRGGLLPASCVAASALVAAAAVLLGGPDGGDWAGATVMFLGTAAFGVFGAMESRTAPMGKVPISMSLTIVLAAAAAFYIARAVLFIGEGPSGQVFSTWLGSPATGILTTVMTIVSVVTVSTLRAGQLEREEHTGSLSMAHDGVLSGSSFERILTGTVKSARKRSELVAVLALTIEDMAQIRSAFGRAEQEELTAQWRAGVRRYSPTFSFAGDDGPFTVMVCFPATSVGDARRTASLVHRQLLDDFADAGSVVIPMMGVGVALTSSAGYDGAALMNAARAAAAASAASSDTSVVIAEAH